jgi:flavin-dependent dehydrogenase
MNERREHLFPNGTVTVRMHKRKRLTLVADREEFDQLLVERVEKLEHENTVLRRLLSEARAARPKEPDPA